MSSKSKALRKKTGASVGLPFVSMQGKYKGGMHYNDKTYYGKKKAFGGRNFIEKHPTEFAKSVRRHAEKHS